MCGIAGKLFHDPARAVEAGVLDRMSAILAHRGPDDAGIHRDGPVGLVSRRLAIQDLSPAGHQPMQSLDRRFTITYNGEIYNFLLLREELERQGVQFRSRSDTEVILALYARHGPACLSRLRGMFAFALWDREARTLFAARDRVGKKPLFYYHGPGEFVFGSEPKAILQDPDVPVAPDHTALHHYLTYGYVPAPWSAFQGIRKLPPAHYLLLRDGRVTLHRYWTLRYTPKRSGSESQLTEELLERLTEGGAAPTHQRRSGGRAPQRGPRLERRGRPHPPRDDRAGSHLLHRVRPARLRRDPICAYGRPAPRHGASRGRGEARRRGRGTAARLALQRALRRLFSASLAGALRDGRRVRHGGTQWRWRRRGLPRVRPLPGHGGLGRLDRVPAPLRRIAVAASRRLPYGAAKSLSYRMRRFAEVIPLEPRRRYAAWMTCFGNDGKAELYTPALARELEATDSLALIDAAYEASDAPTFVERAAHADVQLYLPDDLLVKMDIASMANSLEVRSPLLDHEVLEFAASLPLSLKLRGWTQKYLLRRAMQGLLPDAVLRRSKMGFGVPIDHWFRHELRDMAYDLLLDARARQRGYFRPEVVRRYLDEHAEGRAHHHPRLWSLLMLEQWHRVFIDTRPGYPVAPPPCGV